MMRSSSLIFFSSFLFLKSSDGWFYSNKDPSKYNDNYGMNIHKPPKYSFEDLYSCDTSQTSADILFILNPRWGQTEWINDFIIKYFQPAAQGLFKRVRIATGYVAGVNATPQNGHLGNCGDITSDFGDWDDYSTPNEKINQIFINSAGHQPPIEQDSTAYEYLLNSWQLAWSEQPSRLSWDETIDMTAHPNYFRLVFILTSGSAIWTSLSEEGSYKPNYNWKIKEPIFHRPIQCDETPLDIMQMRLSSTIYGHQSNFMVFNMDELPRTDCSSQAFCSPEVSNFRLMNKWMNWMPGDNVFLTVDRSNSANQVNTSLSLGLMHSFCSCVQKNSDQYHDINGGEGNNTNTDGGGGGGGGDGGDGGGGDGGGDGSGGENGDGGGPNGGDGDVPDNGPNPSQNDDGGIIYYDTTASGSGKTTGNDDGGGGGGGTTGNGSTDNTIPWWWWTVVIITGAVLSGCFGFWWFIMNGCGCTIACGEIIPGIIEELGRCFTCACCCCCYKPRDVESVVGEFADGDFEVGDTHHADIDDENLALVENGKMDIEGFLD